VRSVTTNEEIVDAARHIVVVQGDIHFNYDVSPELVLTRVELIDGNEHQPLEISSPSGCRTEVSFRSRPLQKRDTARRLKLVVAKGLPSTDDASLDADYSADITFPDLERSLNFQSEGMFLSASGWKNVAIESVNVAEAWIAVDRVYRNNIPYALTHQYSYG